MNATKISHTVVFENPDKPHANTLPEVNSAEEVFYWDSWAKKQVKRLAG